MTDTETYRQIYTMLDQVSPLSYDCGSLCDSICCSNDPFTDDESYIYLLPGEWEYLRSEGCKFDVSKEKCSEHFLPASWGEYVYIMHCPGASECDRRFRPIQCRTFPLTPHLKKKGVLEMILCDTDLPYVCPLIREKMTLRDDFVETTLKAWKILIEDKAIRDLVKLDSKERKRRLL